MYHPHIMYAVDAQLTASQVLRAFHHDEFYLFLGAAFTTVGLVSAAFAFIGRKFDALVIWFALFAILYGQRLWIDSVLLRLMLPPSSFFESLRDCADYLVPIPAFLYFEAAGFLGPHGKRVGYPLIIPFLGLVVLTVLFGPHRSFHLTNNILVIACLGYLVTQFSSRKSDPDFRIVRWGLITFVAFALCDNIAGAFEHYPYVEPIGFVFFLGTLGYVAAQRTLHRDRQFDSIQKELDIARRIQMSILPGDYPQTGSFRVATRYVPMTSVAGDFYDFLLADEHRAGLLIADVSGHGVPAALIASMVKLAASSQREHTADPAALLSAMNTALYGNTQNQFVTAAYVYLDAASATLRYGAAAHPPMLLLRDGQVSSIAENGLMLAAFSFAAYTTATHALQPGDRLLLYTDGITEAASATREEFGPDRLQSLLRDSAHMPPQQTADHIITTIQGWSRTQDDDLTVLVCDYIATPLLD